MISYFFTENPPRKVNKPKTNKIPPSSIPKYSKNVRKNINIPKQIMAADINTMPTIWDISSISFNIKMETNVIKSGAMPRAMGYMLVKDPNLYAFNKNTW